MDWLNTINFLKGLDCNKELAVKQATAEGLYVGNITDAGESWLNSCEIYECDCNREIKLKDGTIIPAGTRFKFYPKNDMICTCVSDLKTMKISYLHLHLYFDMFERLGISDAEEREGACVDGCEVEPDGTCCHGYPSICKMLGVI